MSIGKFRHRITIEQQGLAADGYGGSSEAWTTFLACWAEITEAKPYEKFVGQKLNHQVTHRVRIRQNAAVSSTMRITLGARTFFIRGYVTPMEPHAFLTMYVEEGVGS